MQERRILIGLYFIYSKGFYRNSERTINKVVLSFSEVKKKASNLASNFNLSTECNSRVGVIAPNFWNKFHNNKIRNQL